MKVTLLLFFAAGIAAAQSCPSGYSKIADTLYSGIATPGGSANTWAGAVTTRSDYNATVGGARVGGVESDWTITAGVLSICLVPGNYTITYRPARGTGRPTNALSQYWVVGSGGPYTVSAIETSTVTPATTPVPLTLLSPNLSATSPITISSGVIACATCGTDTLASGTLTATVGAVVDGDCGQAGSITLTGAVLGDVVFAGVTLALPSGVNAIAKVTASNTVTVEVCNLSEASYTVASATYKVGLLR